MSANTDSMTLESSGSSLPLTSDLRCPICQKPFVQESSYSRHISYCRKTQNRQRIRNKACRACNSAKTKCTFEKTCRRCTQRGLHCSYDQPVSIPRGSRGDDSNIPAGLMDKPSFTLIDSGPNDRAGIFDASRIDSRFQIADSNFLTNLDSIRSDTMDDGVLVSISGRDDIFDSNSETQTTAISLPSYQRYLPSSSLPLQKRDALRSGIYCIVDNNHISALSGMHTSNGNPSSSYQIMGTLARLQPKDPVAQHNARLIMQSIRAYPYMMLRKETFPPFIHPHWHRPSTPCLPWPLTNCMIIANLFVSRTSETATFLWSSVKSESQRCLDEMNSFSEECLLAAIQVQVMYLIMRLIDGVTQPDELDVQILIAFKVLCQHFKAQNDGSFVGCQPYDWESWIHTESRIRITTVFFLISRVISVFTNMNCGIVEQYRDLPLCSTKGPWEAKTNDAWASEYAASVHTKDAGLRTIGHMIEFEGASRDQAQEQTLDSWIAAADNLGILLNSVTLSLAHS